MNELAFGSYFAFRCHFTSLFSFFLLVHTIKTAWLDRNESSFGLSVCNRRHNELQWHESRKKVFFYIGVRRYFGFLNDTNQGTKIVQKPKTYEPPYYKKCIRVYKMVMIRCDGPDDIHWCAASNFEVCRDEILEKTSNKMLKANEFLDKN